VLRTIGTAAIQHRLSNLFDQTTNSEQHVGVIFLPLFESIEEEEKIVSSFNNLFTL
jgi:hypothetical protein